VTRLVPAEGRLLDSILDASHAIWNEGLTREAYGRYYRAQLRTAWGTRHLGRFALVRGDELLASAKRYDLEAYLDGLRVRVAGVGAVFTQPSARGHGHARELVERLLEAAGREGFELALLFSEIGSEYYRRLGFVEVPTFDLALRVSESPTRGAPATLVRGGDDRDLPQVVDIGRVRADGWRFHLQRDVDFVRYAIAKKRLLAGLGAPGARELEFLVAEEGLKAVAYAVILAEHRTGESGAPAAPRWILEECGDRDPSGARVGAILQTLIAREPAARRPEITGWLPHGFPAPQVTVTDRRRSAQIMMVRGLKGLTPSLGSEDLLYWQGDVF
jgi:GNAT superfamily N-acetyltransferase